MTRAVLSLGANLGDRAAAPVLSADPELTLPHPRAHERAFVLVPWAEVDPAVRVTVDPAGVRRRPDLVL